MRLVGLKTNESQVQTSDALGRSLSSGLPLPMSSTSGKIVCNGSRVNGVFWREYNEMNISNLKSVPMCYQRVLVGSSLFFQLKMRPKD